MKTVEMDRQFMIALHTFDMEKIRETTNYKEMVDASGGNQSGIDLVCQQVMDKLQETKRQMSPEQWNDILNDLTLLAGVSDLNDTPQDGQCRLATMRHLAKIKEV